MSSGPQIRLTENQGRMAMDERIVNAKDHICRSRRTDPETSKSAAEDHRPRANTHAAEVLQAIERYAGDDGCTAAEVGVVLTDLGHIEAQRRLSDLTRIGLVSKGPPRRCGVKGSRMTTYKPGGKP